MEEITKKHRRSLRQVLQLQDPKNNWDLMRRQTSKQWYQVINGAVNLKGKGSLLTAFRSKVVDDSVIPGEALEDYIEKLYHDPEYVDIKKIQIQVD